ncbi:MAG TPA: hypothetical protein VF407_12065 [Polyangiaceae bacterium]
MSDANETPPSISLLPLFFRALFSILAGLSVTGALSAIADRIMIAVGFFPADGSTMADSRFAVALAYRIVFQIGGCALAGRLAKNHPMRIAMILATIGFVGTAASTLATWNRTDMGPHWYALAIVITALPCGFVGGLVAERGRSRA